MDTMTWLSRELGFATLLSSSRDVRLLMLARTFRMFAYGSSTLILALYFAALGHSDAMIGLFMTLTLIGDVLISLILTVIADRLGRRRILVLGAVLMSLSGVVFATASNYWILLLAAILGVISPSGNEIGPFKAVEESTISHLSNAATRADLFALYVVGGTIGASLGAFACGWTTDRLQEGGWSDVDSYRLVFWSYAIIGLIKAAISLFLTVECELPQKPEVTASSEDSTASHEAGPSVAHGEQAPLLTAQKAKQLHSPAMKKKKPWVQLSRKSRLTLAKLCSLFFFDSLASGMVPASLIAFYISRKFQISRSTLGNIMAVAQFISSLGNILASSVSRRIGLIPTMVFTHLPSAIFLAMIPVPTSLWLTVVLLVARSSLSSMDQAPRSAFLAAVVLPDERTTVMGVVNTVKTMSQSGGPIITGLLAGSSNFYIAFLVAGALKAGYDLALLKMFASNKSLEESRGDDQTTAEDIEEREVAPESDIHETAAAQTGDRRDSLPR